MFAFISSSHYLCGMKRVIISLSLMVAFLVAKAQVYDLRVETLSTPLGIDTTLPHFSWKNDCRHKGQQQAAYEIQVASTPKRLRRDADHWQSGRVEGGDCVMIPYGGDTLRARDLCYWRVRTWDETGKRTRWSKPQRFSVGLTDGWDEPFMAMPAAAGDPRSPLLRKQVAVHRGRPLFVHVNSIGYHELWVNGVKADDHVLQPAVSQLDERSHIVTYDISSLVRHGKADIVVWLGQGWWKPATFHATTPGPLVRVEVSECIRGSWRTLAHSDSSWLCTPGGYEDLGTWYPLQFGGECLHGSIMPGNLKTKSLNSLSWVPVELVDMPQIAATPQMFPGNRIVARWPSVAMRQLSDSVWMADMGRVLTGWLQLEMHGLQPGQRIEMEYADDIADDSLFVSQERDRYIAGTAGDGTFCNKFHHHAYRFVRISGLADAPRATALQMSGDYDEASSFSCSDDDLNALHDMIQRTVRCLTFSGYMVDCPHLERMGYGGDGNSSTMTLQTMYEAAPTYYNWLQAWFDAQDPDGGMPHVAPAGGGGGGPYWCAFAVKAPWRSYMSYGDSRIIARHYDDMLRWWEYVRTYSPDTLLQRWPDTANRMWFLGDWLTPAGVDGGNEASVIFASNCYLVQCLSDMQEMASLLGRNEDIAAFASWQENLKRCLHARYYHAADSTYASASPLDMASALLSGVVPDTQHEGVKQKLIELSQTRYRSHIAVGLMGVPIFTDWCVRDRASELMYAILKQRDYPGYLYMIDHGATTTWEYWNRERSRVHNCYNGIGTWFYEAVAGLRRDDDASQPAYRHFFIDPQPLAALTWAECTKETPYGTIRLRWERLDDHTLSVTATLPVGTTATVCGSEPQTLSAGTHTFTLTQI